MKAVELHRLARVLREMAVTATANPGEQPVAASTLAIVEDVAAHPGTSISQIVDRTGLAQSLVSGTTARLTKAGALVLEQDPNDRRRTLVSMNEKRRAEDFAERGARGIGDAIRRAIPGANDTQIAEIESELGHLAQQLCHSGETQTHRVISAQKSNSLQPPPLPRGTR